MRCIYRIRYTVCIYIEREWAKSLLIQVKIVDKTMQANKIFGMIQRDVSGGSKKQ